MRVNIQCLLQEYHIIMSSKKLAVAFLDYVKKLVMVFRIINGNMPGSPVLKNLPTIFRIKIDIYRDLQYYKKLWYLELLLTICRDFQF